MTTLDSRRAKDRALMAAQLVELVERFPGASAKTGPDGLGTRSIRVSIAVGNAVVGVNIGPLEAVNAFIVPWNICSRSDSRFSQAFGAACRAQVNPFHRAKCMGVYPDFTSMMEHVERALICLSDGLAFMECN